MVFDKQLFRIVLSIAWPIIVSEVVDSILWLTDTIFVSRLGDDAIAGVGAGGYASWFFFVASSVFYTGVLVLVAQAVGAGRRGVVKNIVEEATTSALALGSLVAIIGELAAGIIVFRVIGASGLAGKLAVDYLATRLLGFAPGFLAMVYSASLRASGATKPIMRATVTASVINAVLDPLLIYGLLGFPSLGVKGAALASVAAIIVESSILWWENKAVYGFYPLLALPSSWAYKALKLGLPAYLERLVIVSGNLVYLGSVARCGGAALAAHTIGVRIESFAFLPADGVATAAASLVGQEVGRGNIERAKRIGLSIGWIGAGLMGLAGAALIALAPLAPLAFTNSSVVASYATVYLYLAGISEPALGYIMVLASSIRSAGDTITPTLLNLAGLYGFRVLLAYILPRVMPYEWCVLGAWIAMDVDLLGRALVFYLVYSSVFEKKAKKLV